MPRVPLTTLFFVMLTTWTQSLWAQVDRLQLAQRHSAPADVCAQQVAQRFNLPWFDVKTRQDRSLRNGAVLVTWRTARDSGYCEVSEWGNLLRFVVESQSGIGTLDENPERLCLEEVTRQRNVSRDAVKVERRNTDGERVTIAWRTRNESGFCEVSRYGQVDYFKVTQSAPDHQDAYRIAEQVCQRTVADKRQLPKSDVDIASTTASGRDIRVEWQTRYESGYCEVDSRGQLQQFHVRRQEQPQNSKYRKEENLCAFHVAAKLNVKARAVQIINSQALAGSSGNTVQVDWRVGREDGYCKFRRGNMIGSSLN